MKFNKLVRDKIPEIIESSGLRAVTRTLDDAAFKEYLEKKLDEEVAEFHESKSLEELADIYEVFFALCYAYGYNLTTVFTAREIKRFKRGGFDKKILLVETIDEQEGKQ